MYGIRGIYGMYVWGMPAVVIILNDKGFLMSL